jgi:integrase/recombinase XerD
MLSTGLHFASESTLDLEDVRAFQVHLVSTGISWPGLNQIVCALCCEGRRALSHSIRGINVLTASNPR